MNRDCLLGAGISQEKPSCNLVHPKRLEHGATASVFVAKIVSMALAFVNDEIKMATLLAECKSVGTTS